MARSFEQYLMPEETIVWQGRENRTVLGLISGFYGLCLGVLLYLVDFGFTAQAEGGLPMQTFTSATEAMLWIGCIGMIVILYGFLNHYLRRFVITNKRVLIIGGIIGVDIVALPFAQIKNVAVGVGLIGELLSIGNVLIDTGKIHTKKVGKETRTETKYDIIWYIDKPYEVLNHIQGQLG